MKEAKCPTCKKRAFSVVDKETGTSYVICDKCKKSYKMGKALC